MELSQQAQFEAASQFVDGILQAAMPQGDNCRGCLARRVEFGPFGRMTVCSLTRIARQGAHENDRICGRKGGT